MLYKLGACFGIQVGYEAVGECPVLLRSGHSNFSQSTRYCGQISRESFLLHSLQHEVFDIAGGTFIQL